MTERSSSSSRRIPGGIGVARGRLIVYAQRSRSLRLGAERAAGYAGRAVIGGDLGPASGVSAFEELLGPLRLEGLGAGGRENRLDVAARSWAVP